MKTRILFALAVALVAGVAPAAPLPSTITVKLELHNSAYVVGERIRAIVDVANASPDSIDVGSRGSADKLFVELFRAVDRTELRPAVERPFVAPFLLHSSEGQKLETILADHFEIEDETRYLVRAVLVHEGTRYESALKSFDVVPGLHCGGALQMFANKPGLKREFELVHWTRDRVEHLFLKAKDGSRRWATADLGVFMRVTEPKVSVLKTGEVVVLHRATQDAFVRTVFWSLPGAFEFHEHEQMLDPDVAGAERVKSMYRESGEVAPVKKSWWKFW